MFFENKGLKIKFVWSDAIVRLYIGYEKFATNFILE
jgi:hypothetical protein